jgi:type I restriction enzyme M protein
MLDLRNVYRKVSSKIHDFTQGHLDNIHAIVGLYRGDNTLFHKLIEDYKANDNATELEWLTSRFPDAKYVDILGLCKISNRAEIADNDYSLTPGRYVGVEDQIDHDFDYEREMGIIKQELNELNAEAVELAEQIQTNLNELGL